MAYKDWLDADDSYLPTNNLPLLRNTLGRRLINIERIIHGSLDKWIGEYSITTERRKIFRLADGIIKFEVEGLAPIYLEGSYYVGLDFDEYSIAISLTSRVTLPNPFFDYQRYTLHDHEFLDDHLPKLIGQSIQKIRILIRAVEREKDIPRALQDGIEISFDNGTTIILSYMLGEERADIFQILYPEEVRWGAVAYKIDILKGRLPWLYRFRRWLWRALDGTGR